MKKPLPIHPFLFALFPILFVYAQNLEHMSLSQSWASVLALLGLALIVLLVLTLILRDARRAGILISLFYLLFFSFGQVYGLLWGRQEGQAAQQGVSILLILWAVLFAAGAAFAVMIKRGLGEITQILNVVASVLVLISLFNIGLYEFRKASAQQYNGDVGFAEITATASGQPELLPDIYYIILDGYARADVLKEVYGYDNAGILDFLEERGFYVAAKSQANYAHTALSLASSLNMGYLDEQAARIGLDTQDREPLGELIEQSVVIRFLKEQGYVIAAFPTGYSPTDLKNVDFYMGLGGTLNELEIGLLVSTPIPWLVMRNSQFNPYAPHAHRVRYTLDHLADTAELPAPHFVFAHVLGPHPPFVFDENGNELELSRAFNMGEGSHFFEQGGTRDEYLQGYLGQLRFVNDRLQAVLDDLLSRSSRPAIVILQADHGPGLLLDWDDPQNTYMKERLAILNAYLLPGEGSADLYDEITPVNTFRLIFNRYFGADLAQLEDESYFSTWDRPYEFIRVTDSVRSGESVRPSK